MNATKTDLKQMEARLIKAMKPLVDKVVNLELDMQDVKQRIRLLPTKEEFFSRMDETMGELKTTREEHIVIQDQVTRHGDEISDLQIIHPNNMHVLAV